MQCRWNSPDGFHSVVLSPGAVEELRARAIDASLSLPRRGAEIGGLLLGRFRPGKPGTVSIEALQPISCEHRYGPSYTLSDDDRSQFREVLERPRSEGELETVGFYRSYTRRDAAPDAADRELFDAFLPDERCTFLLIEPIPPAECYASFLFRVDGYIPDRPPYEFFSLHPAAMQDEASHAATTESLSATADALPVAGLPRVSAELPLDPLEPVLPAATPDMPAVEDPPARISRPAPALLPTLPPERRIHVFETDAEPAAPRRRRFWLPLAACIILGVGGAVVYEYSNVALGSQWAELRMDAAAQNGEIQLTWDRSAQAVSQATSGVLLVTDGSEQKRIELNPSDLHSGKLIYHPSHPDVLFRVELRGNRLRSWSDSLRVLSVAAETMPPVPANPAPQPAPAAEPAITEASRSVPPPSPPEHGNSRPAAAAVAIHEVQPKIPEGIRSRIETPVVVPVQVRVSASGQVVSASARSQRDGVARYLGDAAAKAARSWRFSPARSSDGSPVESSKTIEFTFAPAVSQ